jgi:hypothetical protein
MLTVSFLPVLVCGLLSLGLGFVWFTFLFGKAYRLHMFDGKECSSEGQGAAMAKSFALDVVTAVVTAFVFAFSLRVWTAAAPALGCDAASFRDAFVFSLLLWVGFFLPFAVGKVIWLRKSWAVAAIEGGYELVRVVLMLLVLWYWR